MQAASLCQQATDCWWRDNHSGWMIYARGKRHFDTLDQLVAASLPELEPRHPQQHPQHPQQVRACLPPCWQLPDSMSSCKC